MDGIHDMGGMHGFGKVEREKDEPVFHAEWEGRTLALNRAMGYTGIWTIDQTRYGIERLPPDLYLTASYYKKWAIRLEKLIVELGYNPHCIGPTGALSACANFEQAIPTLGHRNMVFQAPGVPRPLVARL